MQKRYLTPTAQNTHMTERYRLVAESAVCAVHPKYAAIRAPRSTKPGCTCAAVFAARRVTVAGMPTTPAWYGAKASVK